MGADESKAELNLLRACMPTFSSADVAARVFKYMWRYSYDLESLYQTPILHGPADKFGPRQVVDELITGARDSGRTSLSEDECKTILISYGIPVAGCAAQNHGRRARLSSRVDPQFGPVLMFASSGESSDSIIGLPPLNATLARRILERSNLYAVLVNASAWDGVRALEALLVHFSQIIAEQKWIKAFEIDLLILTTEVGAISAHCELHELLVKESELPRPAIRPYPVQYVSTWTMKDGESVTIRPIRAEDEPLMVKFHEELSDRSVYLRYFQRVKLSTRTSHERLVRVCFLDYDREMALLAEHRDPETQQRKVIAIATLQKEYRRNDGEVAVLISDRYHGRGLGQELIRRLVDFARDEGLGRVTATTMTENAGMCAVFRKLGFELSEDFEDELVTARLVISRGRA
jgi:acetyltransferase